MPRTSKDGAPKVRPRARKSTPKSAPTKALDSAHVALDAVEGKKATQIVLLDVHEISVFTDYFLICNGESERQLKAIAEGVEEALGKAGTKQIGREGRAESGWMLLDYGDLTIHVFAPEQRDYYRLEELWQEGKTVVKIQ
jgi:ribosome-associated protein